MTDEYSFLTLSKNAPLISNLSPLIYIFALMRSKILRLALLLTLAFGFTAQTQAQCAMCRMSAETNLENGGTAGRGLNAGILYMLAAPYLLVGFFGYVWLRNRRKEHDTE